MRKLSISLIFMAVMLVFPGMGFAVTFIINNTNNSGDPIGTLRLISSTPYERQAFNKAPESVQLTFSQPIKPDKSYIRVYDSYGNQLQVGEAESKGMGLSVSLPELTPGKYSVKWKARCRCDSDNEISDNFHFIVR